MSDQSEVRDRGDAEGSASPYVRMPVAVAGISIFVVLCALLGLGLWANGNLREQAPVVATATPAAPALAVAAPTLQVAPTPAPPASPTLAPTAPVVENTPTPIATEPPTPLPTVEPTLAAEVGQAYENFWRVTSQALLELDTTHLSEVMDGDYLTAVTQRIDELRSEGRAIKTQVVLDYAVISANSDSASVVDDFMDNSVYVAIGTEDPLTDPVADQVRTLYKLRNVSGTWKVVDSVRSD